MSEIESFFSDKKWCFNASWGLKGLSWGNQQHPVVRWGWQSPSVPRGWKDIRAAAQRQNAVPEYLITCKVRRYCLLALLDRVETWSDKADNPSQLISQTNMYIRADWDDIPVSHDCHDCAECFSKERDSCRAYSLPNVVLMLDQRLSMLAHIKTTFGFKPASN